jgi:hypothetical protein
MIIAQRHHLLNDIMLCLYGIVSTCALSTHASTMHRSPPYIPSILTIKPARDSTICNTSIILSDQTPTILLIHTYYTKGYI